jgi:hypothetical protein
LGKHPVHAPTQAFCPVARAASLRFSGVRFAAVALLPFVPSLGRGRHLVGEGAVWFFNPNKCSVRSRKCSCFSFVIPPIGIDRVLQHGEQDPVGNRKAPPNSALFSRRNTALAEVTDSHRDTDDNRSILFLGRSISFDPKAMISRIVHTRS